MQALRSSPSADSDRRLVKHLVWMLALKACALYLLWLFCVLPQRASVDADSMAGRWQPDSHPQQKESVHDRSDRR